MIRISLPWILDTANKIDAIDKLRANDPINESLFPIFVAQRQLELLFGETFYKDYFSASRHAANDLYSFLNKFFQQNEQKDAKFSELDINEILNLKKKFILVFQADLGTFPIYLIKKKGNFEIDGLIENGDRLFPESLSKKCPEAILDAMEAGKALAFELSTACGFHIFRVVEATCRRYWDHISINSTRPTPETLGRIANELKIKSLGDPKIYESIIQLTKLHRNPIAHPEYILSIEEAIGIVGMARSVVGAMLSNMPDVPPTTSVSPIS